MAHRGIRYQLAAALAFLLASAAGAEDSPFAVNSAPGRQVRGIRLGAPEMRLSLKDAVRTALEHNINLEISRLGLASAQQGIVASTGIFDPVISSDLKESSSDSPATNQLVGAAVSSQRGRAFDLSIGKFISTGARVGLAWTNTRSRTNSTFFFLNPSYNSGVTLSLTQPLLRGFGTDVNRAPIELARRSRDISSLEFEQTVIGTLQQVEAAYWNLVYAIENVKVQQESLKLAQDLLDQTRTRVRIGTSAPIDIVQSEATVADRERLIIVAENAVGDAEDGLKKLLGFEVAEDWKSKIVPADSLEIAPEAVDVDAATAKAFMLRAEMRQRKIEREISEINFLTAHNATRPQLDLSIGYGYSGVGGTQTVRDPNTGEVVNVIPGGWSDALRQIRGLDYNQWSAGLVFSYALGNHQGRAQLAQRRYNLASADQNLAAQMQSITADVRQAVRAVDAGAKTVAAAEKARILGERNLDAEQKKFANGMSTNFQVLQIQSALANSRVAELQAKVGYHLARVGYQVAVGSLFDSMGITIKDDDAIAAPATGLARSEVLKYGHWAKSAVAKPAWDAPK